MNEDINTYDYLREVTHMIMNSMDQPKLSGTHWLSFTRIMTKNANKNYKKADPLYDAWMCVRRSQRFVFNKRSLIHIYPSLAKKLQR